ncbi:MAG TPA: hypothetical protein PKA37_05205 [Planctomycetota bacterium]|nr:hypothetical protein [Planctomycetota bacterium]
MKSHSRRLWVLSTLALFLAVLGAGPLCAQRDGLGSADLKRVQDVLKGFESLDKPAQRKAILRVAELGTPLEKHLQDITVKEPRKALGFQALDALHFAMGRDLMQKEMKTAVSPYTRWTFGTGEILILKGVGRWMGVRLDERYDPSEGVLRLELVTTQDPLTPLGTITKDRQEVELKGEIVPHVTGRPKAFPQRLYKFTAFGGNVEILSVGTKGFRYGLKDDAPGVYRTGKTRLKDVRAREAEDQFESKVDASLDAHARRAQQYLFRILDDHEPLPTYDTPDEAHFGGAESIHAEIRMDSNRTPIVVISFPHAEKPVSYGAREHIMLTNFVRACLRPVAAEVLVSAGTQELREGNLYFNGKVFAKPNAREVARLRTLFPEDY